jgi:signal transduction histidine kinase
MQDLVDSACSSAEHAHAQRLLRFALRERSDPIRLSLRERLDAVVPLLQQTILIRPLITDFANDLPLVTVGPNELDSSLLNLAANARHATPPESKLILSATRAMP